MMLKEGATRGLIVSSTFLTFTVHLKEDATKIRRV